MIVLAPGGPLWNVAQFVPWLTGVVIVVTAACLVATPWLAIPVWWRPPGLRCLLAVVAGFAAVLLVGNVFSHLMFVTRPFVVHHFKPLYPHATNTSFPSSLTSYVAVVAAPVFLAWRRLGWILVALTAEVAVGCVYVGVHYGVDVVAGALVGGACGAAAWLALGWDPVARVVTRLDRTLTAWHLRPAPTSTSPTRSV